MKLLLVELTFVCYDITAGTNSEYEDHTENLTRTDFLHIKTTITENPIPC